MRAIRPCAPGASPKPTRWTSRARSPRWISSRIPPMARVIVGMSGGVDSSVTAALLKHAGHDVNGVTLNVWPDLPNMPEIQRDDACCALGAVEDARRVADKLDIPY